MYALDFMLEIYARNIKMHILKIFNYDRKLQTFLYANKNERKWMKTYTVYFHLKNGNTQYTQRNVRCCTHFYRRKRLKIIC